MHRVSMLFLVAVMVISLTVPAFAANESYSFDLEGDGEKTFNIYTDASNKKTIDSDPATVSTNSNTEIPYRTSVAFKMYYKAKSSDSDSKDPDYTQATNAAWVSGYYTVHPTYLTGKAVKGRSYYVGCRLDDSVQGEYHVEGKFNADYTTP